MKENNNKVDILNCFTTGSMVFYLAMQLLPEVVTFKKNNKSRYLHTKLFLCDNYENEFTRGSIIGGKTVTRVNLFQNKIKNILKGFIKNPLFYLDINSMYAFIMALKSFPYGKPRFLNNQELEELNKTKDFKKYKHIICDLEIFPNKSNIEPCVGYKNEEKGNRLIWSNKGIHTVNI